MIAPAMTLAIYFIVFQFIAKQRHPALRHLPLRRAPCCGTCSRSGVQTATGVIVNNAGIVKKVSFPREILALASIGSALVFFFFQAIVMVIFLIVFRAPPDWSYLPLLPLALLAALVLAIGPGRLPVGHQRLPPRHATPDRGGDDGVVLGLPDRLLVPAASRPQAVPARVDVVVLPEPDDPARAQLPAGPLRSGLRPPDGPTRIASWPSCPPTAWVWYAALDLGVLAAGVVLFLLALVVFGRLEGNFAEEL